MTVIVDTGPLVALLDRRDKFHAWAVDVFGAIPAPMLTCEAVLSEACFLVRALRDGPETVVGLIERGVVRVSFDAQGEALALRALLHKYRDVPMAFADACLVRMTEQRSGARVLTVDRDFHQYRKNGRQAIPLLFPGG